MKGRRSSLIVDETKHLDGSLSMKNTATSKSNGLSPYNSHRDEDGNS